MTSGWLVACGLWMDHEWIVLVLCQGRTRVGPCQGRARVVLGRLRSGSCLGPESG